MRTMNRFRNRVRPMPPHRVPASQSRARRITSVAHGLRLLVLLGGAAGSVACGDLTGGAALPEGTQSPNTYNTPAGALGVYRGTKSFLSTAVHADVITLGLLTDELMSPGRGMGTESIGATGDVIDERVLDEGGPSTAGDQTYSLLQQVRGNAAQAIGLLTHYAPALSPALRGEMYAIEGYAELLLAEAYCSGVPLSTLDFEQDFTYRPGSTTAAVTEHALMLLDSAAALASDSASVVALVNVLKGRALVDLGDYANAAQAVAMVPDAFQYVVPVQWSTNADAFNLVMNGNSVATSEGGNGLPFSTSGDPRSEVIAAGTNDFGVPLFSPAKYPVNSTTPVVLASGIEARLIVAEAALAAHNTTAWLQTLNALRTTCVAVETCPTPAPAGTGGIAGLAPLSDPGSDSARVTLLFTERAYWLFLTGHRQGDLRRLVRDYDRPEETVYPSGLYFGGIGVYGTDVTLPIPKAERDNNPLFHGCFDRGA